MTKLVVKNYEEEVAPRVVLFLQPNENGSVTLCIEDKDDLGCPWKALTIREDGSSFLIGGLPNNLGLALDDRGRLLLDEDKDY